jgi:hypothetical protein
MRFFRKCIGNHYRYFVFHAVLFLEYYLSDYFFGESEGVVVKNNSIELNLEDIQNDYAGNLLTHL